MEEEKEIEGKRNRIEICIYTYILFSPYTYIYGEKS